MSEVATRTIPPKWTEAEGIAPATWGVDKIAERVCPLCSRTIRESYPNLRANNFLSHYKSCKRKARRNESNTRP